MKKSTFILLFVSILSFEGYCQQVDYNKIILPAGISNMEFQERLVQLAWQNNPDHNALYVQKEIYETEAQKYRWDWLNNIRITGNLNEFNINPNEQGTNVFFPRYNFGLFVPLGTFFTSSKDVKIALSRAQMAEDKVNKAKLAIRSQVLMRFEEYSTYSELLKLQNEVAENEYSRYLVAEEKFKNGEFSFEEFNRVVQSYNTAREKRLNYGMSMKRAKILLEELIGMALEDVER